MFTGIIEELGKVRQITTNRIQIECKEILNGTKLGDSVAVNGVCLTVSNINDSLLTADISPETFKVTSFSDTLIGDVVNLERAIPANGRFGGHIVSGHIDSRGKFKKSEKIGNFYNLEFELIPDCTKYTVRKGSVAINGISLTIAEIDNNIIKCAIIPHTYENTNLKTLKPGNYVNVETDILAKYIEKFLLTGDNRSGINYGFLEENGFISV